MKKRKKGWARVTVTTDFGEGAYDVNIVAALKHVKKLDKKSQTQGAMALLRWCGSALDPAKDMLLDCFKQ